MEQTERQPWVIGPGSEVQVTYRATVTSVREDEDGPAYAVSRADGYGAGYVKTAAGDKIILGCRPVAAAADLVILAWLVENGVQLGVLNDGPFAGRVNVPALREGISRLSAAPDPGHDTVHVLVISHDHGDNPEVHDSYLGARESLAGYAREWWHVVAGDETACGVVPATPDGMDDDQVISMYFDCASESYQIEECKVQRGRPA